MQTLTVEQALEFQGKVERLLVTATDTETVALEETLKPLDDCDDIAVTHIENHTYRLGTFGAFPAVHAQCVMGTRAAGSATSATEEAVRCWTPRAVAMPGIAWGSPRQKGAGLGDVLVASSVQDFENARVGEQYLFRSPETEAGVKLLDRFRSVTDWTFGLPDGRRSSRRLGLLLSGDKLIANAGFRDTLLDEFTRAIGGDMESYGVAQACRGMGVEWIVAKGICDWGDEGKDKTWQAIAARASVSYCLRALSHPSALHGLRPGLQTDSAQGQHPIGDVLPNEIPPATDRRIGRDVELTALAGWLTAGANEMILCFVVGMGGVGKTFLVADVARALLAKGAYPDGVIWHETYDQSPAQVMAHVVSALGTNAGSQELSAIQAEYRRAVQDRRVLIVVDNAVAACQISALMSGSRGSAVLVASRNHMPSLRSRAAGVIELKSMAPDDAVELLQSKSGSLPAEQQTALRNVASLCGHLPLALSIAGSLLGEREMWPSVESLEKRLQTRRLDCLAIDECPDLDVRAVLLLSYERMDAALARTFRSLAILGRLSFGASAVSHMLDQDKEGTISDLARLIGRSVLERSSYGRYVLHDLLRELAAELVVKDERPELVAGLSQRADKYWQAWRLAASLGGIAAAWAKKGNADKAIEYYEQAATIQRDVGDRYHLCMTLSGLAQVGKRFRNTQLVEDAELEMKRLGCRQR